MPDDSEIEETSPSTAPPNPAFGQPEADSGGIDTAERSQELLVHVKFNKQPRAYTAEQAVPLVEMGLKWDSFRPQHEKLRYVAASQGKSVGELIDSMLGECDRQLYQQLIDECGGNETAAGKLFEIQKAERRQGMEQKHIQELEPEQREEAALTVQTEQRLADEFLHLSEEVSDRFFSFSDVPAAVVECAVSENLPLLDAYLRYEHRESRRTAAAQEKQRQASSCSAGSLAGAKNLPETELNSFEQAFRSALQ